MIEVAKEFYRKLYTSNKRQTKDPIMETMTIKVPCVYMNEIKKAHKRTGRDKTGAAAGALIHLIKDASDLIPDTLAFFLFLPNAFKLVL